MSLFVQITQTVKIRLGSLLAGGLGILIFTGSGFAAEPPTGPEAAPAKPRAAKLRAYSGQITMHNVGLGTVGQLNQDDRESDRKLRLNERSTSMFDVTPTSSYPLPVSPNQPRRKTKDGKKKKNWLTPKSNLDGLDVKDTENKENASVLGQRESWGWLADEIMEKQDENVDRDGEPSRNEEVEDQEGKVTLADFDSEEEYIDYQVRAKLEQEEEFSEEDTRAGTVENESTMSKNSIENYADMTAVGLSKDKRSPSVAVQESKPSWESSLSKKNPRSPSGSGLDELNQSFRQGYTPQTYREKPSLGRTGFNPSTGISAPSFSTRAESTRRSSVGFKRSPSFSDAASSSIGNAPTENRSIYALPSASGSFSATPQAPQQAYQPFSDGRQ